MRSVKLAVLMIGVLGIAPVALVSGSGAQESKPTQSPAGSERVQPAHQPPRVDQEPKPVVTPVSQPVYKPVPRGAPAGRVAGGTRGIRQPELPFLTALAPDHTGLTIQEQPTLYWFISRRTSLPLEVTVVDPRTPRPVLEVRVTPPLQGGTYGIRLADHGVSLSPGVRYRWFVALIPDADRRSRDILAGGAIERVPPPVGLGERVAQAASVELPAVYADAGLWYDALAAISELIDAAPHEAALREHRASLISQAELPTITE
jgi:hypothetical protein